MFILILLIHATHLHYNVKERTTKKGKTSQVVTKSKIVKPIPGPETLHEMVEEDRASIRETNPPVTEEHQKYAKVLRHCFR